MVQFCTCMKPLKPCETMGKKPTRKFYLPDFPCQAQVLEAEWSGQSIKRWQTRSHLGYRGAKMRSLGSQSYLHVESLSIFFRSLRICIHTPKKQAICTNICRFFPLDAMDASNRILEASAPAPEQLPSPAELRWGLGGRERFQESERSGTGWEQKTTWFPPAFCDTTHENRDTRLVISPPMLETPNGFTHQALPKKCRTCSWPMIWIYCDELGHQF